MDDDAYAACRNGFHAPDGVRSGQVADADGGSARRSARNDAGPPGLQLQLGRRTGTVCGRQAFVGVGTGGASASDTEFLVGRGKSSGYASWREPTPD